MPRKRKKERRSIFNSSDEAALAERFQFRYQKGLVFDNYVVEQWLRKRCRIAHKRGYISKFAIWLGTLHSQQIAQHDLIDMTIRWVNGTMGYGAFTNQDLKCWQFIGEYAGIVKRRRIFFRNTNDYCFMYPREWNNWKAFTIDAEKEGNATRFINHSDVPNIESVVVFHEGIFRVIFRAIKDIAKGSELFYDYGKDYWRFRKKA